MKEFIEKLITRIMLESASCKVYKLINPNMEDIAEFNAYKKCIEIVNELAEEYINTSTDISTDTLDASTNTSTTNADRIRSMNDEELAEFISKYFSCEYECAVRDKCGSDWDCKRATIEWLQSEVEGGTDELS